MKYDKIVAMNQEKSRKKVDVAKREMKKIKEYAERGYTHAVALDLSKYFDTLNHEKLLNLLRRDIKDERVIQWIKRYLKSGVMENGVVMETEEGSPQGGNISPLLANIYLNEFDQEYEKRGVKFVRYADYTEVETMPKLSFKHRKYHRFHLKISA